MKKLIFSVLLVLSMFAPAAMFFRSISATTCPVKMPETLLSLYRNSDTIYIGRYRGQEEGEVISDDETSTEVEIKSHFEISSTLKGMPVKALTIFNNAYRYKERNEGYETEEEVQRAQVVEEASVKTFEEMEEEAAREMKPGDSVLLFLRNDEESKRLELTDYRDAIKNLPITDINLYEARIKELNTIFAAEKPDVEKIIDWLVRCSEDAATRWEGTYELEQSFNALEYKTQRDAERKVKIANGEDVRNEDYYSDVGFETGRTTIFARLLNDYQKQTLAHILLNSEFQAAPKRPGQLAFVRGDLELIKLISLWADDRIVALFLNRLRGGTYTPSENSELMGTIASMLDDKQLIALSEKYSANDYRSDDIEVDESDLDEADATTADDENAVEAEIVEKPTVSVHTPKDDTIEQKAGETTSTETAEKPAMTHKQLREKLISKFLIRVDEVLASSDTPIRETNKKEER